MTDSADHRIEQLESALAASQRQERLEMGEDIARQQAADDRIIEALTKSDGSGG